ncbi:hypothetical protein [Geodermatophilus tzadiensis]|nr:hypothetical protein [Geodermatophilus tzadiensis]
MSQDVVATGAAALLGRAGFAATTGAFGDLTTAEVLLRDGRRLVLVPMVETLCSDREAPDVDLWHVLVRAADGAFLEFADGEGREDPCPSVLWARRAGVDPVVAVSLVQAALADDEVSAHLALSV